jgi:hypothetical protein
LSSILKALKKLESDSATKVALKSGSQTLDTSKVVQAVTSPRRDAKVILVVSCVLFIGIIAALGYFLLQDQGKTLESDSVESSMKLEQEGTAMQRDAFRLEKVEAVQDEQQNQLQGESTRRAERAAMVSQQTALKTETAVNLPVPVRAEPEFVETTAVVSSAETEQFEEPLYPRLEYSVLELQAITWGVDPQERFALVENRILRTGESIKGYIIDNIHEEYIVVRQGHEKWRVEFRLR